jgi:hypothetical protein
MPNFGKLFRTETTQRSFDVAESLLDRIDFAALQSIFAAELRRSGANGSLSQRVSRNRFSLRKRPGASAWPQFLRVTIGAADHRTMYSMLWTVCHEAAHLVTYAFPRRAAFETTSGGFSLFNEGMTDRIAQDVFDAYIRFKEPTLEPSKVRATWNVQRPGTYRIGRILVDTITDGLAKRLGVDKDEISRALKRHYFSGGFGRDTKKVLDTTFGSGFMRRLRAIQNEQYDGGRVEHLLAQSVSDMVPESTWRDLAHFIGYYGQW